MLPLLRRVAIAEAISFLLLVVGTVVKRAADEPIFVRILGPIHGVLFLAYAALVLICWGDQGWRFKKVALLLLLAVVPLGGFIADRTLLREPATTT